jgi:primosomal protein N' (replication factor Y) (superfamily II helicase)
MRNTTPPTSRRTACSTTPATWRCCARLVGAQVVLASATPSLESWANAEAGQIRPLDLPARFGAAELPEMRAIDMRAEAAGEPLDLAHAAKRAVTARLEAGEQALLFLNRRGYAPVTVCRACGHQIGCDHCDARMVEHRFLKRLVCHQCGETKPMPEACPACGAEDRLAAVGPGRRAAGRGGARRCFPRRGSRCCRRTCSARPAR